MSRITPTLALCSLAALVAVGLLWLPPRTSTPDPAYAPPAAVAAEATDSQASTEGGTEAPTAATVSIANFAFTDPGALAAGQQVTVTNNDGAPHTLTATDGSFDTGLLQPGESAVIVMPDAAGSFAFFCELHPAMTGTFAVSA